MHQSTQTHIIINVRFSEINVISKTVTYVKKQENVQYNPFNTIGYFKMFEENCLQHIIICFKKKLIIQRKCFLHHMLQPLKGTLAVMSVLYLPLLM